MQPTVEILTDCHLQVSSKAWTFADVAKAAIEEHWQRASTDNPKLFNGDVFVLEDWAVEDGVLRGRSLATTFAAYLYWRHTGFDDGRTSEAFASTIIQSSEGGVLLAKAAAGTLNGGQYVSPGGLFDTRDLRCDGTLDAAGAAVREVAEETGLQVQEMERAAGFRFAYNAPYLAVASCFRAPWPSDELLERVQSYLRAQQEPELTEPCVVQTMDDAAKLSLTRFTHLLTQSVFA